jgi:hypothetical protein
MRRVIPRRKLAALHRLLGIYERRCQVYPEEMDFWLARMSGVVRCLAAIKR